MSKSILTGVIICFLIGMVFGQQNEFKSDLSNFCPNKKFQFKTTCYAYAVVYTAMSTEYNIANNITDSNIINLNYFSPGIVASKHNSSLPFYKQSKNCGKYGLADSSLDILKNFGTTFGNLYDCDCKRYSLIKEQIPDSTKIYKIIDYSSLEVNNKYSENSIMWLKNVLNNNHPIVISVYQNDRLYGIHTKDIDDTLPDSKTLAKIMKNTNFGISNHVICILGYNDDYKVGKGYFLLKNNFDRWGNGYGFSWVPYTFILPLIQKAYFIKGIL